MQSRLFGPVPLPDRPPTAARRIDEATPATPSRLGGLATEHAKADAVAAVRAIQSGTLTERLLAVYAQLHRGDAVGATGYRGEGLTDYEAAHIFGVERTTINAARSVLMHAGYVTSGGKRACRYKPTRNTVNAWTLTAEGVAAADSARRGHEVTR